jgi:ABC-type polysaccharide/polyol phosphate export permease
VADLKVVSWFMKIDPITAIVNYQSAIILDGESWTAHQNLLAAPLLALILIVGIGTICIDRLLALQGGINS